MKWPFLNLAAQAAPGGTARPDRGFTKGDQFEAAHITAFARVPSPRAGLGSGRFQPLHLLCELPEGLVELRIFSDAFDLSGFRSSGLNEGATLDHMGGEHIS